MGCVVSTHARFDDAAASLSDVEDGAVAPPGDLDRSLPSPVNAGLVRHRQNVCDLVGSMRVIPLPDEVVRSSVRTLVDAHEEELTTALLGLKGTVLRG